jgi:Farnesoic acid 0-methyl transferase
LQIVGSSSDIAIANTPDVISCSELRWFWIGWLDGFLRVGKGQRYGANPLIELFEPMPHAVNYITVGTNGADGNWEFEGDRGML